MIEKLHLKNFTAFEKLKMEFCPGINLIIGENATGKTHILKIMYSILSALKDKSDSWGIQDKITNVFLPEYKKIHRLIKKRKKESLIELFVNEEKLGFSIKIGEFKSLGGGAPGISGDIPVKLKDFPEKPVYIPVKEMLANAPGFRSLYKSREVHFEEIYDDILAKAFLPFSKEDKVSQKLRKSIKEIEEILGGAVEKKGEEFYLAGKSGSLEFTLFAEGLRKFALLWLLLKNGSLGENSILFWDEPEANLNPLLIKNLVRILIQIQGMGTQIFIATHNYAVLKWFHLLSNENDRVRYFTLFREGKEKEISCKSFENFTAIDPNAISKAYLDIYNQEIERSIGGLK